MLNGTFSEHTWLYLQIATFLRGYVQCFFWGRRISIQWACLLSPFSFGFGSVYHCCYLLATSVPDIAFSTPWKSALMYLPFAANTQRCTVYMCYIIFQGVECCYWISLSGITLPLWVALRGRCHAFSAASYWHKSIAILIGGGRQTIFSREVYF